MDILTMMEGSGYQRDDRPRFRTYHPVIRELFREGCMDGVMKLWKHMQWRNVLPKVRTMRVRAYFVRACYRMSDENTTQIACDE